VRVCEYCGCQNVPAIAEHVASLLEDHHRIERTLAVIADLNAGPAWVYLGHAWRSHLALGSSSASSGALLKARGERG
jgi:hypothetical protein